MKHLGRDSIRAPKLAGGSRAEITEFLMPDPKDLPHDIAVERSGTVLVTGMFTHRLYRVDPRSRRITEIAIPVPNANPRAIEIDSLGQPWVVLGSPKKVAMMTADSQWRSFDVGMYAHSLALDRAGKVPHSGPRRLDVDAKGIVWIPAYAANLLLRFDPKTRKFTEIPRPFRDAVPYIVRVDPRSGTLWIGAGAADALLHYDPDSGRFESYRLPSRGVMIRHLAIDSRNGAVWAAYGASPGIPARIARVQPR